MKKVSKFQSNSLFIAVYLGLFAYVCGTAPENGSREMTREFTLTMKRAAESLAPKKTTDDLVSRINVDGNIVWALGDGVKTITISVTRTETHIPEPVIAQTASKLEPFVIKAICPEDPNQPLEFHFVSGQGDTEWDKMGQYMTCMSLLEMLLETGRTQMIEQPGKMGTLVLTPFAYVRLQDREDDIRSQTLLAFSREVSFTIIPDFGDMELQGVHLFYDRGNHYSYRHQDLSGHINHAINIRISPRNRRTDYLNLLKSIEQFDPEIYQSLEIWELRIGKPETRDKTRNQGQLPI